MKKTDLIILGLMALGAIWALFLPNVKPHIRYLDNHEILYKINTKERYLSVDDVAKIIMTKNPGYILVDVRKPEAYKQFTLPGSINIPLDSLFTDNNRKLLEQDVYKLVFFSNGTSLADRAWLLSTAAGYTGLYVMKGGLNAWFNDLLMPKRPSDIAPPQEFDLYNFRRGAAAFFTGASAGEEASPAKATVNITVPVKKKEVGGGCE